MDLKAELYRKQEQFKQEKLGKESAAGGFKPKPIAKVHHDMSNSGAVFSPIFFFVI